MNNIHLTIGDRLSTAITDIESVIQAYSGMQRLPCTLLRMPLDFTKDSPSSQAAIGKAQQVQGSTFSVLAYTITKSNAKAPLILTR